MIWEYILCSHLLSINESESVLCSHLLSINVKAIRFQGTKKELADSSRKLFDLVPSNCQWQINFAMASVFIQIKKW